MVPFPLAVVGGQVLERRGANALRERGRTRRVGEEAEDGGNGSTVGAGAGGRLVDTPCRLRLGHAGDLCQKIGTCVSGVTVDCRADTVSTALLAGVRCGVVCDPAKVRETTDICAGAATGFQFSRAARRQLLMGV